MRLKMLITLIRFLKCVPKSYFNEWITRTGSTWHTLYQLMNDFQALFYLTLACSNQLQEHRQCASSRPLHRFPKSCQNKIIEDNIKLRDKRTSLLQDPHRKCLPGGRSPVQLWSPIRIFQVHHLNLIFWNAKCNSWQKVTLQYCTINFPTLTRTYSQLPQLRPPLFHHRWHQRMSAGMKKEVWFMSKIINNLKLIFNHIIYRILPFFVVIWIEFIQDFFVRIINFQVRKIFLLVCSIMRGQWTLGYRLCWQSRILLQAIRISYYSQEKNFKNRRSF